jgi:L-ascorbate metabolism protein UlaG (beta-lactamase superfamily)
MTDTDDAARAELTFVGTATTVLRLGGFTVLTDPNFLRRGERVHLGYGLTSRRRTSPALDVDELPELDAVLLSHLHGDHFDRRARAGLTRSAPVVTTPHASRRLTRWGFDVAALRTWQEWELSKDGERLRVTSVPARHGPVAVHRALPPVMGSVVELVRGGVVAVRVYITGDTVNRPFLRAVHDRYPSLDAMVVHLGGTRIAGLLVTMDARQGADLVGLHRPPVTVPVHFDDYGVFRSPLSHFLQEVRDRGLRGVHTVLRGDTVSLVGGPDLTSPG